MAVIELQTTGDSGQDREAYERAVRVAQNGDTIRWRGMPTCSLVIETTFDTNPKPYSEGDVLELFGNGRFQKKVSEEGEVMTIKRIQKPRDLYIDGVYWSQDRNGEVWVDGNHGNHGGLRGKDLTDLVAYLTKALAWQRQLKKVKP